VSKSVRSKNSEAELGHVLQVSQPIIARLSLSLPSSFTVTYNIEDLETEEVGPGGGDGTLSNQINTIGPTGILPFSIPFFSKAIPLSKAHQRRTPPSATHYLLPVKVRLTGQNPSRDDSVASPMLLTLLPLTT
jgi:hypothetical protein